MPRKTTSKPKKVTSKDIEKACEKRAENWAKTCGSKAKGSCGCGGAGYFLGFLGAAVYFISNSTGFWNGVLGFLKAIVWPAFLVYGLLKYLGL
ncbi:TPA: hypothetical protein HA265_00500 [Candidatus Woesearchaeota archaeon]|nr:hypothetical protein [Candidatus Woesearchaeota archaeon]